MRLILSIVLVSVVHYPLPTDASDLSPAIDFVQTYCLDCHGPDAQEGDRRFDQLLNIDADLDPRAWHEILDRVNLADMPPEDAPQPSDDERLGIGKLLTDRLLEFAKTEREGTFTNLRRLNNLEYDASVRQLLGLEDMLVDPTAELVPDGRTDHFRTVAGSLVTSDVLLSQYLDAAGVYLDLAIERRGAMPKARSWTFEAPFGRSRPHPDGLDRPGEYQHIRENPSEKNGYLAIRKFRAGAPSAGRYQIRVRASAIDRQHPYKPSILNVPSEDPLRLAIIATDGDAEDLTTNHSSDVSLAEWSLRDDEPQWYEVTTWLDRGMTVRMTYPNGPAMIKYARHKLMHNHRDLFPKYLANHVHVFQSMHPDYDPVEGPRLARAFEDEQERLKLAGLPHDTFGVAHRCHTDEAWLQFYAEYQGPRVRVHEVQLHGPLPSETPDRDWFWDDVDAEMQIARFAGEAYRRRVTDSELQPLLDLHQDQLAATGDPAAALKVAYQAILCSPAFLYHRTAAGPLNDHELASRLSYFLWCTPPDETLRQLADEGNLGDPRVLREQTTRLLADRRRTRLIDELIDAWLQLEKLGTMLPDRTEHPAYYNERLGAAMRTETHQFIDDLIERDAPVANLVDGRETFLNSSLARLYEIDGVAGHEFRRVRLDDPHRGGLLGQASVLTATANGLDTSPVLRGVWVLECLLGTPPSPPPPDIEPIEPDTRGTTTIREQLAAHRDVATCAACHKKIDPPGFALESYDEIGQYRDNYLLGGWRNDVGPAVDPSGQLASGESFNDVEELRQRLSGKMHLVVANLLRKLLVQATGRIDDPSDWATVMGLMRDVDPHAIGFAEAIELVVQSEAFGR